MLKKAIFQQSGSLKLKAKGEASLRFQLLHRNGVNLKKNPKKPHLNTVGVRRMETQCCLNFCERKTETQKEKQSHVEEEKRCISD